MKTVTIRDAMKISARVLVIVLVVLSFACGTTTETKTDSEPLVKRLVVLHTNDTHGHPVKFSYQTVPDFGGLPARATLVRNVRKAHPNVLVLDAGDLNTGRPESTLFKAQPDIEGYNAIGYDAMAVGNHEFDNPIHVLEWQMSQAHFPFLSANVKTADGRYLTRRYIIKKFRGFRVAVFGLTTKTTKMIANPLYVKDLIFEDEIEVAKKLVPKLREKADIVIALVHMGIYPTTRKGSRRLASDVDGIDLIVDGHTHTKMDAAIFVKKFGTDHRTLIVQAWKWGMVVGRTDLWIENGKVKDYRYKAIPVNIKKPIKRPDGTTTYKYVGFQIKEDETLLKSLSRYVKKVDFLLSEVVGSAEESFLKNPRDSETALGDMIADSMFWYTKSLNVDFAIQNGGGIRSVLPAGKITRKDIYEVLPFDNSVMVLTMRGADVQALFDYIATIPRGKGAYPQVSEGLSFTINRKAKKCENILIKGKPLDGNRIYKIATNSYLANGGDGFRIFLKAIEKYDTSAFQRDVFVDYIKHLGGKINPNVKQRIRLTENLNSHMRPFARAA